MSIKSVAILGAGAGGLAAAADLSSRGFSVRLCELPQFEANISALKRAGGITTSGLLQGFIKVDLITTDVARAVTGADLVMLALPAYGVETFAQACIPHLKDGQMVVLNMAATAGSLRFALKAREIAPHLRIKIAELSSLTYAARKRDDGVEVLLKVQKLFFSAFPAADTPEMLQAFQALYPAVVAGTHVLETTLNNGNPVTHPAGSMLNAGAIEFSKGDFCLYSQGISQGVARVIQSVDDERLALCRSLGLKEIPTRERLVRYGYTKPGADLYEEYHNSEVFRGAKGPHSLQDRYFTEDIPYGLVLWSSLGRNLGVPTGTIDAIITIATSLCQHDFRREGLTAEKLGLAGMNSAQLNKYLQTGQK